jgi:hypothetical protein
VKSHSPSSSGVAHHRLGSRLDRLGVSLVPVYLVVMAGLLVALID